MDTKQSWTARTAAEKARARRLVKAGKAKVAGTAHETYIGKRGIVSYEAWYVEPILPPAATFVDVCTETAYGVTVRLPFQIRVF